MRWDTKDNIEWLYNEVKISATLIGKIYGVSRTTVARRAIKLGIKKVPLEKGEEVRLKPEEIDGLTAEQVAKLVKEIRAQRKKKINRIRENLKGKIAPKKESGPKKGGKRRPVWATEKNLKDLYIVQGLKAETIQNMYGIKEGTLKRYFREFGISKYVSDEDRNKKAAEECAKTWKWGDDKKPKKVYTEDMKRKAIEDARLFAQRNGLRKF